VIGLSNVWISSDDWHWEFTKDINIGKYSELHVRSYWCKGNKMHQLLLTSFFWKKNSNMISIPRQVPPPPISNPGTFSVKSSKLKPNSKPFNPILKKMGVNVVLTPAMNIIQNKSEKVEVQSEEKPIEVHSSINLIQKHSIVDENNKENISNGLRVQLSPNEEKKSVDFTKISHTPIEPKKLITHKYGIAELLEIYRTMGNFTNHTFTAELTSRHPKCQSVLSVSKPKYILEVEAGCQVDNVKKSTCTFMDELDLELKNIGILVDLDGMDPYDSDSSKD